MDEPDTFSTKKNNVRAVKHGWMAHKRPTTLWYIGIAVFFLAIPIYCKSLGLL